MRRRLVGFGARLAQHDPSLGLAAEGIVVEQGKPGKADQKQAEQHGERLHSRERQAEPARLQHQAGPGG